MIAEIKKELNKRWCNVIEEREKLIKEEETPEKYTQMCINLGKLNMLTEIITEIIPEIEKQEEKQKRGRK